MISTVSSNIEHKKCFSSDVSLKQNCIMNFDWESNRFCTKGLIFTSTNCK
ncbi:hypothetical protein DB44_BP00240 [Candidatus Protochlamydia amoebophila]|uniref:Uncharacterized protein n=1 Tax=Candidatus Protochlamydia amoebophila TaxID=362787 RepID=A0A0C1HEG0_9BACT|nr:hypothetical protein DB44_BP00240 [Candidatus Protochlamydia amoebophila]